MVLVVAGHCAGIQDRDGARFVFEPSRGVFPRLKLIWADSGSAGQLVEWVLALAGWVWEIIKRPKAAKGFVLLPHRWIVERTFGWFAKYRRRSLDYEEKAASSEAWIRVAMIHRMARRLAPAT